MTASTSAPKLMRAGYPTSLAANSIGRHVVAELETVEKVLAGDLEMTLHLAGRPDFAEGLRAVLIDKDRRARWHPARLEEVDLGPLRPIAEAGAGSTGGFLRH